MALNYNPWIEGRDSMAIGDVLQVPGRPYKFKVIYLAPPALTIIGTSANSPTRNIAQDLYGNPGAPINRTDEMGRPSDQGPIIVVDTDRLLPVWQSHFRDPNLRVPAGPVALGGQMINLQLSRYADVAQLMRDMNQQGANAIQSMARTKLMKGEEIEQVARWVVKSRNELKEEVRAVGPVLFKKLAEMRNRIKYGNPVGPSYEAASASRTAEEIIDGVAKTSPGFNRSAKILRAVGVTLEVASFAVAATQDSPESLPPLPKSEEDQVATEITRLRLGIPADANIDRHGHLKKDSYLQIDPTDFAHGGDEIDQETEEIFWFFGLPVTYNFRGVKWTVPGKNWR
jgi:hypothetical protein